MTPARSQEANGSDGRRNSLNCPSFHFAPKESGVIWLLWWCDGTENKALLEPITADDHYQIGVLMKRDETYAYQYGAPGVPDPAPSMIPAPLREVVTTVTGITIVDVANGEDRE